MSQTDTSASASLPSQASTITEHISITASHLDYQQQQQQHQPSQQNVQNDGAFTSASLKQYRGGDEIDVENEIVDEDFQGNSLNRGPYFEVSAAKNLTAIAGQSAYLNCRVRNLGNRTVSLCELIS